MKSALESIKKNFFLSDQNLMIIVTLATGRKSDKHGKIFQSNSIFTQLSKGTENKVIY